MRKVFILFLVLICILAGSIAYIYWPKIEHRLRKMTINKEQEVKDIQKAKELLNQSKPEEALAIIYKYKDAIDNRTPIGQEWLELLIRASESTLNLQQLMILYEYYPKAFESHEKASMLVGEGLLLQGQGKNYQALRDAWKGRETNPEIWFVMDSDKLLLDGKRKEAIELLESKTFSGKADTPRLIRLALLNIFDNPKAAWDYLALAYSKDPTNPDIRSYRAKLLESVGKNNLALNEYLGATETAPKNLYLKDQLAEFYLRNFQYGAALQIWSQYLKPPTLDFFWIKTIFWNKVAQPLAIDWKSMEPPKGKLQPFIEYLLALKPNQFWDKSAFEKLDHYQEYLKTQQSTFWLRLLDALKQNKEKEAAELLDYNPFRSVSWNPILEETLKKIIHFRQTGRFTPKIEHPFDINSGEESSTKSANQPTTLTSNFLFTEIEEIAQSENNPQNKQIAVPVSLQELLKGPDAYSATFLAAGWNEAALQLNTLSVIPKTYPPGLAAGFAAAINLNRGNAAALEFATVQNQTPDMIIIISELLLAGGNSDAALDHLSKLAKEDNDFGIKAAWLSSLIYIDKGQFAQAKAAISSQPKLANQVVGKETLARIYAIEGNEDQATKIYQSIEKDSPEAKSFLARKAFQQKDWKRARELTEQLLGIFPTNGTLQQNLKQIQEEENKAKNTK
jgi:hypothetical protein